MSPQTVQIEVTFDEEAAMPGEDFVHVKMSAAGEKLAHNGPLRVAGSRYDFTFKAGESQRVTRNFDWDRVLKHHVVDGEALFELAAEQE